MILVCPTCSQDFETNGTRLYCSKHCRKRAKKKRYRARPNRKYICQQCKIEFTRNSDRGYVYIFCSSDCARQSRVKPEASYASDSEIRLCGRCGGFLEKGRWKCCMDCFKSSAYQREQHLKKAYGLSVEEYDSMVQAQNGLCAICRGVEPRKNKDGTSQNLAVDHSHLTGVNRELLCTRCNSLLGLANDSLDLLRRSIAYLQKHGAPDILHVPNNPETEARRMAAFEKSLSRPMDPALSYSDKHALVISERGTLEGTLPEGRGEAPTEP